MEEKRPRSFCGNKNIMSFSRRDLTLNIKHLKMVMFFDIVISLLGLNPRKSVEMRKIFTKILIFILKTTFL